LLTTQEAYLLNRTFQILVRSDCWWFGYSTLSKLRNPQTTAPQYDLEMKKNSVFISVVLSTPVYLYQFPCLPLDHSCRLLLFCLFFVPRSLITMFSNHCWISIPSSAMNPYNGTRTTRRASKKLFREGHIGFCRYIDMTLTTLLIEWWLLWATLVKWWQPNKYYPK
jgi:hypothetical protein